MERDALGAEEVMKRISRQMDEEMKMKRCDFIIMNDEKQLVMSQVLELHNKFLRIIAAIINNY